MIAVGGHKNKPLDQRGTYRAACAQFASDLGWDKGSTYHWWEQFALLRMQEQRWPRPLAEWMAMRDLRAFFDKRGQAEPD